MPRKKHARRNREDSPLMNTQPGKWHNQLCGCFSNVGICLISFIAPCYVAGKIAEYMDKSCCVACLACFVPVWNVVNRTLQRGTVRSIVGIDGGTWNDCVKVTFCPCCALAQEAEELKFHFNEDMARQ